MTSQQGRRGGREEFLRFSLGGWKASILPLVIAAILLDKFRANPVLVFAISAIALVPLAGLIGRATEELAGHLGAAAGGLLNAALGNVAELVIGIVALWGGQIEVVKASITGSIIVNLLLVFGCAAFFGGLGREKLVFSAVAAGADLAMLFLAVVALVVPALFQLTIFGALTPSGARIERLSLWVAAILLFIYLCSLIFVFRTHRRLFSITGPAPPTVRKSTAVAVLVIAAGLAAYVSDILVGQINAVTHALGWTDLFIGLVIIAIIGNAVEHSTAIMAARHEHMDLALNIAVGSSTQIALFVAPVLVVISQFHGAPLSLVFHPLEIVAIILSVAAIALVALDGETHWFEGLQLIGVYLILTVFFYYLPARM